jgi:hypothetical protein
MTSSEKIKYINIDSRFHEEYIIDRCEYKIRIPHEIRGVKSITVSCVEIPMTFYNICGILGNNEFQVIVFGKNASNSNETRMCKIIIPDGNYTPPSIVAMISRLLSSNEETSELEIRLNASNIVEFVSMSSETSYEIQFDWSRLASPFLWNKNLGRTLGFCNSVYSMDCVDVSTNTVLIADNICDFTHPRYLFLEIYENDHDKKHVFVSSLVCERVTKHAIARIVVDQRNFPYGSVLTANIFNGLLISDTRIYNKPIDLHKFYIRIINEYGIPLDMHGFDFSFCITATIQDSEHV